MQTYDQFLADIKKGISLDVPFIVRNYADWQPQVLVAVEDIMPDAIEVIRLYKDVYNTINSTYNANASDILLDYYLKDKRPSGCCYCIVPKHDRFAKLRNKCFAIIDAVFSKDLVRNGHEPYAFRYCHDTEKSGMYLVIDIWSKAIEERRDYEYNRQEYRDDCEEEHLMEKQAEIAYAESIGY